MANFNSFPSQVLGKVNEESNTVSLGGLVPRDNVALHLRALFTYVYFFMTIRNITETILIKIIHFLYFNNFGGCQEGMKTFYAKETANLPSHKRRKILTEQRSVSRMNHFFSRKVVHGARCKPGVTFD